MTRIYPANISHIGKRQEQQDRFGWFGFDKPTFIDKGGILGLVCDGMGGMKYGGTAAEVAIETFVDIYRRQAAKLGIPDALQFALRQANAKVCEIARQSGTEVGEMGTTLSACVIHRKFVWWVSVGDSRIYLKRNKQELVQLTTDHIYAVRLNQLVTAGKISRAQALADPDRDTLISYLGMENLELIDHNIKSVELCDGDKILVCSDGIYGSLTDQEINECLNLPGDDIEKALEKAVLSKERPYQDNFTALVFAYQGAEGMDLWKRWTSNITNILKYKHFILAGFALMLFIVCGLAVFNAEMLSDIWQRTIKLNLVSSIRKDKEEVPHINGGEEIYAIDPNLDLQTKKMPSHSESFKNNLAEPKQVPTSESGSDDNHVAK